MFGLPTGTVTFLLTDVEGSTRLWEQYPDGMRSALARHDELIEHLVREHGGAVVRPRGEGDSRFAVFAQASGAIAAAAAIQLALRQERWTLPEPLLVRMAVHTGEADLRDGDYYGSAVNRCARLRSIAHGGQVLVSSVTASLVREQLQAGVVLRRLGIHALRGLSEPESIFELRHPLLSDQFPPLSSAAPRSGRVPVPPTPLIGRERELRSVSDQLLQPAVRLLTLTGPGGVGKTRLALGVAEGLRSTFIDGIWFVDLSAVRDPTLVLPTIAQAFGVREAAAQSAVQTVSEHLADKHLLLIVDNFEQVLDAGPQIAEVLATCPDVKVLATSRELLHLRWEHAYAVAPLDIPDARHTSNVAELLKTSAVALLLDRARATDPGFILSEHNAAAVAELCVRLDGLPLALELAASRFRALPPADLLRRLSHRSDVLRGPRDAPDRHQSLRVAIAWSYDLLSEPEQRLFRRMAVFAGGCTLDAAESVCDPDGDLDVVEGIEALVDRSLLRQVDQGAREVRFRFLETVRESALERLSEQGEQTLLQRRHVDHFLQLAETGDLELAGPQQAAWLARLERDHDNFRAALRWAIENDAEVGLRLAIALSRFWARRSFVGEGRAWLDAALEHSTAVAIHVRALGLSRAGTLAVRQDDNDVATVLLEASLRLAEELGDKRLAANVLGGLGWVAQNRSQTREAIALFERTQGLLNELGDIRGAAVAQHDLACCWLDLGEFVVARPALEQSLSVFRESGDLALIADGLLPLGQVARHDRELQLAAEYFGESLRIANELGGGDSIASSLEALAGVACDAGEFEQAASLLGAADAQRSVIGSRPSAWERPDYDRDLASIHAALDSGALAAAWAEGQAMSVEQAMGFSRLLAGRPRSGQDQ
jgi:predicted ATPase/class 3 adenylate cyclase